MEAFVVHPRWTGTGFTPYLAALILSKFAALGSDAVLLPAHPNLFERMTASVLATVQRKIISMYRLLGFEQYDTLGHMAAWFPNAALHDFLDEATET